MSLKDDKKACIAKWPFLLADVLLIAVAVGLSVTQTKPLTPLTMGLVIFAVIVGACFCVAPFIIEFRKLPLRNPQAEDSLKLCQQVMRLEFRVAELEERHVEHATGDIKANFEKLREERAKSVPETKDETAQPITQAIASKKSVHELLGISPTPPQSEKNLPTSLSEIDFSDQTSSGMVNRAIKRTTSATASRGIGNLIRQGTKPGV